MNRLMRGFLSLLLLTTGLWSCKREDPDPVAGKGGQATLHVFPMHHSVPIDSCMVYIKYNATDRPTQYDDSAKAQMIEGRPTAIFEGLKKGQYFIYGIGYDPNIFEKVEGGIPYEVKNESSIQINLPVTEVH